MGCSPSSFCSEAQNLLLCFQRAGMRTVWVDGDRLTLSSACSSPNIVMKRVKNNNQKSNNKFLEVPSLELEQPKGKCPREVFGSTYSISAVFCPGCRDGACPLVRRPRTPNQNAFRRNSARARHKIWIQRQFDHFEAEIYGE